MKRLIIPLLLIVSVVLSVSCHEKKKREKKPVIIARTLDDYAGMPGGVVLNMYADSTPRDIFFYRVDEQGNRTDEVVKEVHCYDNRNIYIEGDIKHTERDGVWNAYFKNGRLQATCTYREGIQVGPEKVYYENGNLMYSGQYDNGICTGKWEFFDERGVRTMEVTADDTTIVCRSCPKCLRLMGHSKTKGVETIGNTTQDICRGKYTFTDVLGNEYTLTLKSDKTATIESHYRGFSTTYYGSWEHFSFMSAFEIRFPYEDTPYMNFTPNPSERERGSGICLSDNEDFLYKNSDAAKAKNPKLRFKVKKVK